MTLRYFCLIVLAGGTVYVCIELLWRGRSHWSMFLDSGLCAALIGMLNEWAPGAAAECAGASRRLRHNGFGAGVRFPVQPLVCRLGLPRSAAQCSRQICPQYFCAWLFIALLAVLLDDGLRLLALGEPLPQYRLF